MLCLFLQGCVAAAVLTAQLPAEPSASVSNQATASGQQSATPKKKSRVLFITSKSSTHCAEEVARLTKSGGEFDRMRAIGWKIGPEIANQIRLVDEADVPEVVKQFEIREFPIVAYLEGDEIVRAFRSGCTTPLDAYTFAWLAKGIDERPPGQIPEIARVDWTGNYPLRGNHWTIDGMASPSRETLLGHLRGPIHGPQIRADYVIESWSYEELRSLHDNLHEVEMGGVSFANSTYFKQMQKKSGPIKSASGKALGR